MGTLRFAHPTKTGSYGRAQKNEYEINIRDAIRFSVTVDGEPLLRDSLADLRIGPISLAKTARAVSGKTRSVEWLLHPAVPEKFSEVRERYNELTLPLSDNFSISFRAFDNGVAYRFSAVAGFGEFKVYDERAEFRFADSGTVYFPEEQSFISHNERAYLQEPLGKIDRQRFASLPLLVDSGALKAVITESGLRDYPSQYANSFIVGDAFVEKYDQLGVPRRVLSRSLEDTGTMIESLVPWSTTSVFILATLGVSVADYWHWQLLSLFNIAIAFFCAASGIGCFLSQEKDVSAEAFVEVAR